MIKATKAACENKLVNRRKLAGDVRGVVNEKGLSLVCVRACVRATRKLAACDLMHRSETTTVLKEEVEDKSGTDGITIEQ